MRERDTCRECPYAFLSSTVFTSLPYLLVAACLTAIVLIPMAGLNASGECFHRCLPSSFGAYSHGRPGCFTRAVALPVTAAR